MYAIIKYMYFKKCFRHFSTIFNPLSDKRLKTLNNQSTVLMLNNTEITTSRDRDAILPRTRDAEICQTIVRIRLGVLIQSVKLILLVLLL